MERLLEPICRADGMNGCHNRAPLKTLVVVQDGWYMDGYTRTPRMASIPNPMTKTCQYTRTALGAADKGCAGCKWQIETTQGEKC